MSCCDRRRSNSWVADAPPEDMDHAMKIMDYARAGLRACGGKARSRSQVLLEHPGHVDAIGLVTKNHQRQEEQNLEPTIRSHVRISPDAAGLKPDTLPSAH